MARLLSLLLLYQAGYEIGRYISLETAIETTKECYDDLERALPAVSRPTIARALRELSAEGVVRCVGRGRDATWENGPVPFSGGQLA